MFPSYFSSILLMFLLLTINYSFLKAETLPYNEKISGKVFRAGAAISNITPPLGEGIVGGWSFPPAANIHDQLNARCLVLDDGDMKLAFVVVDLVLVPREVFDQAKVLIHQETGLPVDQMMMSAVHTHSGPSVGVEAENIRSWNYGGPMNDYQRFVIRRIADGVRIALNRLEPANIGWGSGTVPEHVFNRRWKMKEPVINPFGKEERVQMNPGIGNPNLLEPAGPTDPEVSFISVQSTNGKPIALLGNYSLHYVGGVKPGDVSADYFAVFADRIQELLDADRQDPPFVGIMSNGTSGDINNINFKGPPEKSQPYAKMKVVADDVAREVLGIYKITKHHKWVRLKSAQSTLTLKVRRATPEMLENVQKIMARPENDKPLYHPLEKVFAERVLRMEKEWPDKVEILLQAFRIGDLGVAAIPFEVFAETGLEIKAKSPLKQTFTIELANGHYQYLPTPEQIELGGYETWLTVNRVEKEASRKIVAELMALFSTLQ